LTLLQITQLKKVNEKKKKILKFGVEFFPAGMKDQ